jgi:hypothetical protein
MNVLSKRFAVALFILVIAYAFCLELCAREDAALVVLGAGAFAKVSAIVAMMTLVLLRIMLFVLMPGYLAAKLLLGYLRRRAATTATP